MSSFDPMTMEEIEKIAAKKHCRVVVAEANQLQFDLDDRPSMERFREFYEGRLVQAYGVVLPKREWNSKSGNTHVVLTLPSPVGTSERIAMQAMGGSDPGREFAALRCHLAGSPHPVLLFQPLTVVA